MKERVAMIGLDAGDLDFIQSNLHALPNLQRALGRGTVSRLTSTADLLTGSVWPTFCTGSMPGVHGIYHHLQWDPQGMRLRRVAPDWLDYEPFWVEMERRGFRVVAVDVPMTFPSSLRQGIEVLSWGSHDTLTPFTASSVSLKREVIRRFGKHPMGSEITVKKTRREIERIGANLVLGAQRKGELCQWLLSNHAWDFFIGVFGECHRGGHILWPEVAGREGLVPEGALLEVYQAVDKAVGKLVEFLSDDRTIVIIFALHGMGSNTSQEHFIPRIMDRVNGYFKNPNLPAGDSGQIRGQKSVMRILREKLPARIQNAIGQAVPIRIRDAVVDRSVTGGYVWRETLGFPQLADLTGYIRLNIRGREEDGQLQPDSDEMKSYVDWVCKCLRSFQVAGSGENLVKDIHFSNKEYPGARSSFLPDMIVTWGPVAPADHICSEILGEFELGLATGRTGNHRPDGFCVFLDPGQSQSPDSLPTHIRDLSRFAMNRFSPI